jgi:hypothetical protein
MTQIWHDRDNPKSLVRPSNEAKTLVWQKKNQNQNHNPKHIKLAKTHNHENSCKKHIKPHKNLRTWKNARLVGIKIHKRYEQNKDIDMLEINHQTIIKHPTLMIINQKSWFDQNRFWWKKNHRIKTKKIVIDVN